MSITHRVTRKPALFRHDARCAAGAMVALFALATQSAVAQEPGTAPRREIAPVADASPPSLPHAAGTRPEARGSETRDRGARRPVGWAVALVLIVLALRNDAKEAAEGA